MRRATFYSNSRPRPEKPVEPRARRGWRDLYTAYERQILLGAAVLLTLLSLSSHFKPVPVAAAVAREKPVAALSPAAIAYEAVKGAIVRVRTGNNAGGTGVVIVSRGVILTSLHVVAGAERIRVTFADGLESDATVVREQPENDLAVLQVQTVPDDLAAAVMRPRAELRPGDPVVAVGFPFGIGPSVSAGIVSGLRREYRAPSGESLLSNLIQFDAAVNPGSSGGPLLNAAGEVVGIVTAMVDPGGGGFAGIGFAVPVESAVAAAGTPPF